MMHPLQCAEHRAGNRIKDLVGLGTLIVAISAVLFAALHYWPPHG